MKPRDSCRWSLSPDGNRIAYLKVSQAAGAFECTLEDRDLEGGPAVLVTADSGPMREPSGILVGAGRPAGFFSLADPTPSGHDSNLWR